MLSSGRDCRILTLEGENMRKIIVVFIVLVIAALASADIVIGNGKIATERRVLPAFRSISINGSGTLRVHRGAQKVEIASDSNILAYITTSVSGDELKIGVEPFNSIMKASRLQFDVTLPELAGIVVTGSGDVYIDSFNGNAFTASVSGSGGIKANLNYTAVTLNCSGSGGFDVAVKAGRLDLRCSGSGDAFIGGSADRTEVAISGSGTLAGRGFTVGDARITISGSGEAEIRATKSLDVVVSGSGSVKYWGTPTINQRVNGSGRISRVGD